ncbi:MAG: type III pantothenate kinase [Bacillota bacterium]|nr:MAG: type III pantothenate kinase [Bacillota bacterium]
MILAIDVGNTNIKYGVFDGDKLAASFRVASQLKKTADEYGAVLTNLLVTSGIGISQIDGVILSSVIPSLNYTICHMCEYFFKTKPLVIGPGVKTGLNIKADNPREIGSDIIVNSVGAYKKYGGPVVVIDFGTATTFDVVSHKGELIGCIIACGMKTSLESLAHGTAQLPMIELAAPKSVLGRNTETAMQAGIVFGMAGLVERIIKMIKAETGYETMKVIATGGMGKLIKEEVSCIDAVDRTLTLEGLKFIYDLNKKSEA